MNTSGGDAGLQSLLQMLQADPTNSALRRRCVSQAIAGAEYDVAGQIIEERLREAPQDPHALFDYASVRIASKDYQGAIQLLQALMSHGYRQPGILINIGLCHYGVGEFAAARAPLQEAYELGDRSAGLIRLLVSTLHHLGDVEEGVSVADANAAVAKQDGAVAGVFALLYLDADQKAAAARWAKIALQRNPRSVDGLVVDATLKIAQLRTAEAERELKQALELAPETGRAWLGLATLALLAKDLVRAKELLQKTLQYLSTHVGTWHLLAWTELAEGHLESAQRAFDKAMDLDRNFAETHGGLAAVAALRRDWKTAERSIAVAERLDPTCISAKFARAVMLGTAGDPSRAQEIIVDTVRGLTQSDGSPLTRLLAPGARRQK